MKFAADINITQTVIKFLRKEGHDVSLSLTVVREESVEVVPLTKR